METLALLAPFVHIPHRLTDMDVSEPKLARNYCEAIIDHINTPNQSIGCDSVIYMWSITSKIMHTHSGSEEAKLAAEAQALLWRRTKPKTLRRIKQTLICFLFVIIGVFLVGREINNRFA
jgi:hypothetical protein